MSKIRIDQITSGNALDGYTLVSDGSGNWVAEPPPEMGSGDVVGPAGVEDGHLAVFDGVTGKLLKDGGNVGGVTIPWDVATVTAGPTQNRNTTGTSITRQTGRINTFQWLKIVEFKWTFRNTGIYDVYLSVGPGDVLLKSLVVGRNVTVAGTEETFDLSSTPLILSPGTYFFTCKRTNGVSGWCDYNATSLSTELFYADGYWTDGAAGTWTIPLKITAYKGPMALFT
jgi:hypothetical protein